MSDALDRLLHSKASRHDKIIGLLSEIGGTPTPSQIRNFGVEKGFRKIASWNLSEVLKRTNGAAVPSGGGWRLTQSGLERAKALGFSPGHTLPSSKKAEVPSPAPAATPPEASSPPTLAKRVFVVHGHDEAPREAVARFLERLGLSPIILHEQASRGMTVAEKLSAYSDVGFAVVLLTPDDLGRPKHEIVERERARQNVVLELGFFLGKLGRARVCALLKGSVEIPSDYHGVIYIPFDAAGGWQRIVGQELEAAGHEIDWNKVMRQ